MSAVHMPVRAASRHRGQPGPTTRDLRVTVRGVPVQYVEAGSGPPLLLLHGHEQSATSWRWVMPALARTHRVLALSLPGHGGTGLVSGYAPGADLAPFVAGFLDTLEVGPVDVVGHSAGGAVALRLALADPHRVHTLTLVDSAGLGRHVNPLLALDTAPGLGELAILFARLPGGALARSLMSAAMLFAWPWRAPIEFFTEAHATGGRPGQLEASTAMARALFELTGQREVLVDRLGELEMPTLVIWGALDYVLPAYQAPHAVSRLRRGRLEMFPSCGHLPHVEHPARFAQVLGRFLTEHQNQAEHRAA